MNERLKDISWSIITWLVKVHAKWDSRTNLTIATFQKENSGPFRIGERVVVAGERASWLVGFNTLEVPLQGIPATVEECNSTHVAVRADNGSAATVYVGDCHLELDYEV